METVLIAAIAAVAPCLAVLVAWNQQRAAVRRIEVNTNGQLDFLRGEIDRISRVRATERAPGVIDSD